MIGDCHMCFKHAELQPVIPNAQAKVCRACAYKLNQVIGFMRFYSCQVIYQPSLTETVTPPNPPKSTKKAPEKETGGKPPVIS